MNTVRVYPWIVIGWLLSGIAGATAVKPLPDSSFEDWTGLVHKTDLNDQSVLFEYTARSFSGRVSGAMLAISFIPRFNCEPMVTVSFPSDVHSGLASSQLEFTFGRERRTFTGLVDRVSGNVVYAVAASASDVDALRDLIEVSSRVNVRVFSGSDSSSRKAKKDNELAFSLFGSRLATLAAERHCLYHEPLTYDPD